MMEKLEPNQIYSEYEKIKDYCSRNNLFTIVEKNEKFYEGNQWEGVDAPDLPKPVVNVLQRVVKYLVASLSSNDVAISIKPFSNSAEDAELVKPIVEEIKQVIEDAKMKENSREVIRNSAVDGCGYTFQYFNADFDNGQPLKGRIEEELIDNTRMFFGNPYSNDIQKQPYIIIALRQHIAQVKREAKNLGLSKDLIAMIKSDNDQDQVNDDSDDLVTVLIKLEKHKTKALVKRIIDGIEVELEEDKTTVWMSKSTQNVYLIEPYDTGYSRYHIAQFGWDSKKNSYLYTAPMTAVIPNQIFINKTYAIAMMYGQQSAFPKIIYDRTKVDIKDLLNTSSPSSVANLEMMGKLLDFVKVPDFSGQILELVKDISQQTKECMGVNDASLGNVSPDNTSAIIQLQEASSIPLEIQRQQFYIYWEDVVRNVIDIMTSDYGTRDTLYKNEIAQIDFTMLKNINYRLNVDIGAGSQFSEIAQINTLDKMLQAGLVKPQTYIESIPDKYLTSKEKILQDLEEQATQVAPMSA